MSATEHSLGSPMRRDRFRAALTRAVVSPRFAVYLACTIGALVTNYLLGKEMMWDTLDYHLYAGFSALHDRFSQDYFAAGPQAYFNPYIYVPFYLLATSRLPALAASSILAVLQSANLWLTYELALEIAPRKDVRARVIVPVGAVLLAFLNPILISQLGSSYADIVTGEMVLGGWLLLARAVHSPGTIRMICAGTLLGVAGALKLTNSAHALSGFAVLLFVPGSWRERCRYTLIFGVALGVAFAVVAAPWAMTLERHFGNPLFPLLNGVFHSRDYTTGPMLDHRFMPDSIAEALWRPFAIVEPLSMVDNELPSPDLRYAALLILASLAALKWGWPRNRHVGTCRNARESAPALRVVAALGCGFLLDWVVWLSISGNGRYFIPMACIAAVLVMALVIELFGARPKVCGYLLAAIFCVQIVQLSFGSAFRFHVRWDGRPWFEISVPKSLTTMPALYFTYGDLSNSFVAPFLASGSGLINIAGGYELDPAGVNGKKIETLIRKYSPHVRMLMVDPRVGSQTLPGLPDLTRINGELGAFGLQVDRSRCARIAVEDASGQDDPRGAATTGTGYLLTCVVVRNTGETAAVAAGRSAADAVFDRLEDACPALFYPPKPATQNYSGKRAQVWVRRYPSTGLSVYIGPAGVQMTFGDKGGTPAYLGRESDWEGTSPRLECGRENERYYARLLPTRLRGSTR